MLQQCFVNATCFSEVFPEQGNAIEMKADEDELHKNQARALSQALYDLSKKWWWSGIAGNLGVFFVGTVIVLWSPGLKYGALLIFLIYLTSELCLLRSDAVKGLAETILRKLDFEESFDWKIKGSEMSDYVMRSPARLRKSLPTSAPEENYFASSEVSAPVRAVENVQESSWWSKHLAERMGHLCLTATCLLLLGSILILVVSIDTVRSFTSLSNIGRVVTSALMLVFSLGLLKLMFGYYGFSKKAARVEQAAEHLLKSGCEERDAVKLLHEYQVARATSPLIPTQLWKWMRDDLNDQWGKYRRRSLDGG